MKKLLSLVSLFSLILGSLSLGMQPASAQPLHWLADVNISFTGFGRILVIKNGSDAFSFTVNTTSLVVTLSQGKTFTIEDQGRNASGARREISVLSNGVAENSGTSCNDSGSFVSLTSPGGNRTVTIAPTEITSSCGAPQGTSTTTTTVSSGGGGGGGGSGSAAPAPAPTPPTVTPSPTPADAVFVFKDGKFVAVSKEEAAKLEAGETGTKPTETKPTGTKPAPAAPSTPTPSAPAEPAPEQPSPQAVGVARAEQVHLITTVEAPTIAQSTSVTEYVQALSQATGQEIVRNEAQEEKVITDILPKLNINLEALLSALSLNMAVASSSGVAKKVSVDAATLERIVGFVTYGTPTTLKIGEGERAGVLNSYIAACGKVPQAEDEWSDLLKIASGRFPSDGCDKTKERSQTNFKRVYKRDPKSTSANDQAALNMMQYGLLPVKAVKVGEAAAIVPNRDTLKEKKAILEFNKIYNFYPKEPTAWNVVRAIAYSGAKR